MSLGLRNIYISCCGHNCVIYIGLIFNRSRINEKDTGADPGYGKAKLFFEIVKWSGSSGMNMIWLGFKGLIR